MTILSWKDTSLFYLLLVSIIGLLMPFLFICVKNSRDESVVCLPPRFHLVNPVNRIRPEPYGLSWSILVYHGDNSLHQCTAIVNELPWQRKASPIHPRSLLI